VTEQKLKAPSEFSVRIRVVNKEGGLSIHCELCNRILFICEPDFPRQPMAFLLADLILAHNWEGH
jgi:hypothetical protein